MEGRGRGGRGKGEEVVGRSKRSVPRQRRRQEQVAGGSTPPGARFHFCCFAFEVALGRMPNILSLVA